MIYSSEYQKTEKDEKKGMMLNTCCSAEDDDQLLLTINIGINSFFLWKFINALVSVKTVCRQKVVKLNASEQCGQVKCN